MIMLYEFIPMLLSPALCHPYTSYLRGTFSDHIYSVYLQANVRKCRIYNIDTTGLVHKGIFSHEIDSY